jgi:IclR family transcriptional regulator, KDG regulon repressor
MEKKQNGSGKGREQVRSVERALSVLELLASKQKGLSTMAISRLARVPKTSTSYLLRTLVKHGYVKRDEAGLHTLGIKLLSLGGQATQNMPLREVTLPHLRSIVDQTRFDAHLAILDDTEAVYVERVEGPGFIKMATYVGRRMPPHVTAVGKALMCQLDQSEVKRLFDKHNIKPRTTKTITSLAKLLAELNTTRSRGYAIDDEESSDRVRCVAAPIIAPNGEVIAAIGISGTVGQMPDDQIPRLGSIIRTAAIKLSGQLGTRGTRS